jgi:hypothetical protein
MHLADASPWYRARCRKTTKSLLKHCPRLACSDYNRRIVHGVWPMKPASDRSCGSLNMRKCRYLSLANVPS